MCVYIVYSRSIVSVYSGGAGLGVHLPCRRAGNGGLNSHCHQLKLGTCKDGSQILVGRGSWLGRLDREDANL